MYEHEIKAEIDRGAGGLLARFLRFQNITDPEKAIVANQAHYWAWLRLYVERKRLG